MAHGQDYVKAELDKQTRDNILLHKGDLKQAEVGQGHMKPLCLIYQVLRRHDAVVYGKYRLVAESSPTNSRNLSHAAALIKIKLNVIKINVMWRCLFMNKLN